MKVSDPKFFDGLFFMCDILGYGNLIKENTLQDIGEMMKKILKRLEDTRRQQYDFLKENEILYAEIVEDWDNNYELKYYTFSDTIMIYPNINYKKDSFSYGVSAAILIDVVNLLFNYLLCHHKVLVRGSIVDNEYAIIDTPFSIFGKAIVEAHKLGEMQNWGGIIISESLYEKIKKYDYVIDNLLVNYDNIPIKEGVITDQYLCSPYVTKWVDSCWKNFIKWPEIIVNSTSDDATLKIVNTMKFYYENL